jgi:hypothetical protein
MSKLGAINIDDMILFSWELDQWSNYSITSKRRYEKIDHALCLLSQPFPYYDQDKLVA